MSKGLLIALVIIVAYIVYDAKTKNSEGLGDTVAHFLQSIGIEKKPGCGCKKKHQWLNKWFPYPTPNQPQNSER